MKSNLLRTATVYAGIIQIFFAHASEPLQKRAHSADALVVKVNPYNQRVSLTAEDLSQVQSLEIVETEEVPGCNRGRLGQYKDLELSLASCELEDTPPGLEMLALKVLILNNNRLRSTPPALGSLTNLSVLDLSVNDLADVSTGINWERLQKLNVAGNRLEKVPEGLKRSTNLQQLFLGYNPLTEIPDTFAPASLIVLSLPGCGLREIPTALLSLPSLYALDLHNNQIASDQLFQLTTLVTLEHLNLSANYLASLPQSIWVSAYEALFLDGNYLDELPSLELFLNEVKKRNPDVGEADTVTYRIKTLSLARNRLTRLPVGIIVRNINLAGNQLELLPSNLCNTEKNSEYIRLGNNRLKYLPTVLRGAKVRGIDVSNNPLVAVAEGEIPADCALALDIISSLQKLTILDLSFCNLQHFPAEMGRLVSLETLILDFNSIRQLPFSLAHMQSLETLSLYQNGFGLDKSSASRCCYDIMQGTSFSCKAKLLFECLRAFTFIRFENFENAIHRLRERENHAIQLARAIATLAAGLATLIDIYSHAESFSQEIFQQLHELLRAQKSFLRTMIGVAGNVEVAESDGEDDDFDGLAEQGSGNSSDSGESSRERKEPLQSELMQQILIAEAEPQEFADANRANWSDTAHRTYTLINQISTLMESIVSFSQHLRFIIELAKLADTRGLSFGNIVSFDAMVDNNTETTHSLPKDVKRIIARKFLQARKHFDNEAQEFKWMP